jgi:hypothetical protein
MLTFLPTAGSLEASNHLSFAALSGFFSCGLVDGVAGLEGPTTLPPLRSKSLRSSVVSGFLSAGFFGPSGDTGLSFVSSGGFSAGTAAAAFLPLSLESFPDIETKMNRPAEITTTTATATIV